MSTLTCARCNKEFDPATHAERFWVQQDEAYCSDACLHHDLSAELVERLKSAVPTPEEEAMRRMEIKCSAFGSPCSDRATRIYMDGGEPLPFCDVCYEECVRGGWGT